MACKSPPDRLRKYGKRNKRTKRSSRHTDINAVAKCPLHQPSTSTTFFSFPRQTTTMYYKFSGLTFAFPIVCVTQPVRRDQPLRIPRQTMRLMLRMPVCNAQRTRYILIPSVRIPTVSFTAHDRNPLGSRRSLRLPNLRTIR